MTGDIRGIAVTTLDGSSFIAYEEVERIRELIHNIGKDRVEGVHVMEEDPNALTFLNMRYVVTISADDTEEPDPEGVWDAEEWIARKDIFQKASYILKKGLKDPEGMRLKLEKLREEIEEKKAKMEEEKE